MPKQIIYTKGEILEAAFELFKKEGMAGVSARKIAAGLGSSTAPVYTSFSNIDEIKNELLDKSLKLLLTYTEREYTTDIFLNIGVGMLEFAKEHKIIYRTLFVENNSNKHILKEFNAKNAIRMKKEKSLQIFSDSDLEGILDKLTIFTHGLASFICADMLEDTTTEYLTKALFEAGKDIIGATLLKNGKLDDQMIMYLKGGHCPEKSNHHQRNP